MDDSGRVRFQRDMGVNNRVGPGVSVIWNPNLILNFPAQFTDAPTNWPVLPYFTPLQFYSNTA